MKALLVGTKMEKKELEKLLVDDKMSKSEKIRKLFDSGLETKEIAGLVGVRYNFVYNVLQNHVIMNDIQVETVKRDSKKDDIVKLLSENKSLADISRATKTNYNYIWKISKELKMEAAAQVAKLEEMKGKKVAQ